MIKPLLIDCEGLTLTEAERRFFNDAQPLGFILFARNCESKEQISALVADMKSCVKHRHVPVLIDQEGGRVQRLRPPNWRAYPNAQTFADMACTDPSRAARACYVNARLMAHDLAELGINTDCAPVADIRLKGAHDVIGDRAFGSCAAEIVPLARAQAQGLMDGGVMPVLKHIPGHGRALVDSHLDLPEVTESLELLRGSDFAPFKELADLPMAMTAHIRYHALDSAKPATLSPKVIELIRHELGFDGLLMSDDMSMKALKGEIGALAAEALAAGCDVVLHCNDTLVNKQRIAEAIPDISAEALRRNDAAFATIAKPKLNTIAVLEQEWAELLPATKAA